MISLEDVTRDVVLPAVLAVFDPGEVDTIEVGRSDDMGGSIRLALTAQGETFVDLVVQGDVAEQSAAEWCERLRSHLVDFVAESRFGWGQDRDDRPVP